MGAGNRSEDVVSVLDVSNPIANSLGRRILESSKKILRMETQGERQRESAKRERKNKRENHRTEDKAPRHRKRREVESGGVKRDVVRELKVRFKSETLALSLGDEKVGGGGRRMREEAELLLYCCQCKRKGRGDLTLRVAVPEVTARTSAPRRRMRNTFSDWRSMSCSR